MDDAPDFPSGRWLGFYLQHGQRCRQDSNLESAAGRMRGVGSDGVGRFVIAGVYDAAARTASWRKTYPGSHSVLYDGFRDGKGIWGFWGLRGFGRDGFHVWPAAAGGAAGASEPRRVEAPIVQHAGAGAGVDAGIDAGRDARSDA